MAPRSWTYEDVVKAMRLKGYSLRKIAQELGATYPATRYQIRNGNTESIRALVKGVLGEEPWTIWPERYPSQWLADGPPAAARAGSHQ